ncbi:MAG: CsgG/HfaB family protein [Nitrospirales bacterium]|nr:hypothetical protein [Nitrospirales bacterium]
MSCCHKQLCRNTLYSSTIRQVIRKVSYALSLILGVGLLACQTSYDSSSESDTGSFPSIDSVSSNNPSVSIPLAVYPLKNYGSPTSVAWVGPTLTELLISDLSHWSHLTIVSRGSMGSVLREQWIQKRHSDSEELIRVGRLQGARLMVQGGFLETEGQITVDLQIIDVETGVVWDTVRAQGRLADLHLLEQSLVRLLLERLPRESSVLDAYLGGENLHVDNPNRFENSLKKSEAALPARELPSQLVFQEDLSLLRESQSQSRNKIVEAVKKIFDQGFTVELGRPFHGVRPIRENGGNNVPFLFIPLGVYAEENRMRDVMSHEISSDVTLRIFEAESSFRKSLDISLSEQRNVIRHLAIPRRMFVRARSEQDEIVAVFSRWEWRTDRVMSFTDGVHMKMPFWPNPFMAGIAEFPISWLERDEMVVTFDTVFLEVNQEEADVVVEWVDFQQLGKIPDEQSETEETLIRHLQKWIQDRWVPSLAETLPFTGYLPHNKQRAHLRLHVEDGVITHLDRQYAASDPVFVSGLETLATQLLYACPWCESEKNIPEILKSADFRIQCTLVKPIDQLGLGSRLP